MKSKTADITAKYQKMIDNIQWHLKTNKPTDKMELQKLYQQINDYREMIVDLETVASQFQHPVPDEAGEVYVWVKASERLPTDKDGKESSGKVFIRNTHTNLGMMWPIWEIEEMCDLPNIEWLSPAPPSGEDAGKGWISVEDKTPIAYKTGVWDGQKSDLVLTYNAVDDTHCIATLYEGYLDGNHFKDWYHVDDFEIPTPTHWKPLTAPKP